jgi:2-polyprenyl-3-methyl-5-hydroxy-6-metoxy-1,4-benzoquinol methylase
VYAVDLEAARLARVSHRFPWIRTLVASADAVPDIANAELDAVISTMVMEHVPDEHAYLAEIQRMLQPGGRAYVTTVKEAAGGTRAQGVSVLDTSPARVHGFDRVRELVASRPADPRLERTAWFPLIRRCSVSVTACDRARLLRALRSAKVPIPGYYVLELVVER